MAKCFKTVFSEWGTQDWHQDFPSICSKLIHLRIHSPWWIHPILTGDAGQRWRSRQRQRHDVPSSYAESPRPRWRRRLASTRGWFRAGATRRLCERERGHGRSRSSRSVATPRGTCSIRGCWSTAGPWTRSPSRWPGAAARCSRQRRCHLANGNAKFDDWRELQPTRALERWI